MHWDEENEVEFIRAMDRADWRNRIRVWLHGVWLALRTRP